jgi:hypothetical protein
MKGVMPPIRRKRGPASYEAGETDSANALGGKGAGCLAFIIGGSPARLAAAPSALSRLQAMDNRAETIQTKSASANSATKQQTRASP